MKRLVCYRLGRAGYKIGDVVEVPDDVDQFDRVNFREVGDESTDPLFQHPAPSDEDSLQAQLNAADSDVTDNDSDKAEVND